MSVTLLAHLLSKASAATPSADDKRIIGTPLKNSDHAQAESRFRQQVDMPAVSVTHASDLIHIAPTHVMGIVPTGRNAWRGYHIIQAKRQ